MNQGLDDLVKQKRLKQSLKNPKRENLKTTQEDLDDFIEIDEEGERKLAKEKKITYASNSSDEEDKNVAPSNQPQITQFMGQNKKKQKTGIMLTDDIDMEKVLEQPVVEKVTVNQVIRNEEELYKAQFHAPIQPQKETNEDDLDELFELMAKQKERKDLQQQQVMKKPQPVHRKVELKMEINQTAQEFSSLSFEQIKQGTRDVNDILESNNSILFYWIDIYEDQIKFPGALFVFGKVKNNKYNVYDTCSLYFDDYPKKIYLSYENGMHSQEYLLQECQLLMKRYLGLGVKDYKCQFVDKQYAFEISDIPTVTSQYLEVTYTQKSQQQIPVRLDNAVFKYALQSTQTTIEQFLIYNKIKGPCWLQVKSCKTMDTREFHLRTQHCLQMEPDKFIVYKEMQPPPLKVLSLAIKSCQVNREEQIVAITCAVQNNIDQNDAEVPEQINYYTMTRMPSDSPLPPGYIKGQNKQIKDFESEYSLMSEFLQYVEQVDPDALVGHDIMRKQLEMLYTRIAKLKVSEWNRMSRLQKRESFPKSLFVRSRSSTIGRLIIDTWLQASDMTKSNDYSLSYLCQQFLKQECKEIESDVTMQYMSDAFSYQALLQWNIKEAKYTIQLMQKLQIVSLTRQLTNIAGNVWNRSLINQRAERNEMLLMHEFFVRGYILPDRMSKVNLNEEEREQQQRNQEAQKTYGGGLVFEPKADIYTQFILLLDFNSLYPSIIMEYKICFTTVIRDKIKFEVTADTQPVQKGPKQKQKKKKEEQEEQQDTQQNDVVGEVDPDAGDGILPQIIEKLVNMRKQAKKSMNQSEGLMKQVYNIKQLAVKLVANSIYGCLGFSSSRFYAVGIASLITKLGRKILLDSKQTVERNHDVIYGDTDSVMICTRQPQANNLSELLQIGQIIVKDINKKYKKLVLGIDGVFETLLLLKKKKYAGIKIDNLEQLISGQAQEPKTKRETKGIDIVRREYCDISKKMQSYVLDILLTTKNRDTIFDDIYTLMSEIKILFDYLQGLVDESVFSQFKFIVDKPLQSDFIIVKQLSKSPLEFADGINHPHVQVAKRMMDQGRTPQSLVHHFIRYVICKDDTQKNISMRAYTIEEMIAQGLSIDHNYYLSTQIFDPIVRLCKNINGLMISQMASILGLKSYQHKEKSNFDRLPNEAGGEEENQLTVIESIVLKCPKCSVELKLSNFFDKNCNLKEIVCINQECTYTQIQYKSLLNQTRLRIKQEIKTYYDGNVKCTRVNITSKCFTLNQKCFGTCCSTEDQRKKLKSEITESEVNDKVDFLEKFQIKLQEKLNPAITMKKNQQQYVYNLEKLFAQPYQLIKLNEIFNKLEL